VPEQDLIAIVALLALELPHDALRILDFSNASVRHEEGWHESRRKMSAPLNA
jgi:hypothetical protein